MEDSSSGEGDARSGLDVDVGATVDPEFETRDLFEGSTEDERRSILFAWAIAAGVVSVVAVASTVLETEGNLPVAAVLLVFALAAFAFAGLVVRGWFPWLFDDDQIFWQIFGP